jgi:hypothetical protein
MKYTTLAQANRYYEIAQRASLMWRPVEHKGIERFSTAVYGLSRSARALDDDTGWREFLYPARRARSILTTVPLPLSHPALGLTPLLDQLERSLPALRVYGGDEAGNLGADAAAAGREIVATGDAPLLDAVLSVLPPAGTACAMLLPIPEYTGPVERHLHESAERPDLAVLSRYDMANLDTTGRLIVVGPLYWYERHEYVLTSPRAPETVILKWSWLREQQPQRAQLEGSRGGVALKMRPVPASSSGLSIDTGEERVTIDWASVGRELSRSADTDAWDVVPARAAVLAGRYAVLLPESGDRLVWLLDPQAPPEHRVARVDVADLEPGHVILLRTSGGGDLIVPIADEILGRAAPELRRLQRLWKSKLTSWARNHRSIRRAAAELGGRGCSTANTQNLRNWLGERSLRTESHSDWRAMMDVIALSSQGEEIWHAMGRLHSAHIEAGRSMARRLRDVANTVPLDALHSVGAQAFTLPSGGSVTAFRVESFSPSVLECAPSRLMVATEVRDHWLT